MQKVTNVLLLLRNMVYEGTGAGEALRFAKYYRKKGLDVLVILWGPMGVMLGKKNKTGMPPYDKMLKECLLLDVRLRCCEQACIMVGIREDELIDGIEMIQSYEIAELILEYRQNSQLVINL